MSYADARFQREVQQMRREFVKTKEREQQTRRGCLELAQAVSALLADAERTGGPASDETKELVERAGALLAPDPD